MAAYASSKTQTRPSNNFRENLSNVLGIYSNHHSRPGYLNTNEAYSYLNWIHTYYGNPKRPPKPEEIHRRLSSKPWMTYKEFIDFIEPYYRL